MHVRDLLLAILEQPRPLTRPLLLQHDHHLADGGHVPPRRLRHDVIERRQIEVVLVLVVRVLADAREDQLLGGDVDVDAEVHEVVHAVVIEGVQTLHHQQHRVRIKSTPALEDNFARLAACECRVSICHELSVKKRDIKRLEHGHTCRRVSCVVQMCARMRKNTILCIQHGPSRVCENR